MNCREVHRLFVAYLDHEVIPSEQTMIEAHLAGCASCERDLSALRSTRSRLNESLRTQAAQAAPSPQAFTRLHARLAEEARTPSSRLSAWRKRSTPGRGPTEAFQRKGAALMKTRWRIAFGIAGAIVIASIIVASVPSARASAGEFFGGIFGVTVSTGSAEFDTPQPLPEGTFILGFRLDYVPQAVGTDTVYQGATVSAEPGAVPRAESLFHKGDSFLYITTAEVAPGQALPDGTPATVNSRPAVMNTGLAGEVQTPPGPGQQQTLDPVAYENANKLTWDVVGTRIEMLSNLPVDELQKIAEGLEELPSGSIQGLEQGLEGLPEISPEGPATGE